MPSIVHELVVKAPPDRVFRAMATPEGLDRWWTKTSQGKPQEGAEYGVMRRNLEYGDTVPYEYRLDV